MFSSTALYSRESSRARSDEMSGSGRGSNCTHVVWPVPATPVPTTARDHAADHEGLEAAAEPPHVLDLGDGADLRVARADPGHEQELAVGGLGGRDGPLGLIGLDREGHDHAREHHTRGQGQEREDLRIELCHLGSPPKRRCVGVNALPRHGIPECKQDYSLRTAGRVGRPILQSRCSSASPTEPAAPSSWPRKRRGCSTTTTSGPSTSCSASVREHDGVAGKALASLDITLEAVRRQVEEIVGQGQAAPMSHIPFTPRAKKVLELLAPRGAAARPQLHRDRAHPARPDPRGRGRRDAGPGEARART